MPPRNRNKLEADADRLYLLSLFRQAGEGLSMEQAGRMLNERRSATARSLALQAGLTAQEAEEAAQAAVLNQRAVQADFDYVRRALRRATVAGAAAWIQERLDRIQRDIDRTYDLEDMALQELERSRLLSRQHRTGQPATPTSPGSPPVWQVVSQVREERAGNVSFLRIIGEQIDRRTRLDKERMTLLFGQSWLEKAAAADSAAARTLQQLVTGDESELTAAERVEKLYVAEVERLAKEEELRSQAWGPELVALQKARADGNRKRFELVKGFAAEVRPAGGDTSRPINVAFVVRAAEEKKGGGST